MAAMVIVAALGLALFLWWLRILVTLLREGPSGSSPDGWLASVVVVTVLGPLGALIYLVTRPDRRARSPRS